MSWLDTFILSNRKEDVEDIREYLLYELRKDNTIRLLKNRGVILEHDSYFVLLSEKEGKIEISYEGKITIKCD